MFIHLAIVLSAFLLALTSYQPAQALANSFTSKPVRSGDNLLSILKQQGFSEKQRQIVLAADPGIRRVFLTLDTKYLVRRDSSEAELIIFDSQANRSFRIHRKGAKVTATKYTPKFNIRHLHVEGRVIGSIMGSILKKVKSNRVASRFTDAYVFDISSPKSLQRGAHFSFTVEKKYVGSQFIKYGEIVQTSLEISGKPLKKKFVRYKTGGVFFNELDLLEDRPFYAPVDYIKIASTFQPNRLHPITKRRQPHMGVDFELPRGYPVFAARTGTVVRYGHNRAAGNYVVLLHSNGMETSYNHMQRIEKNIRQGRRIKVGAVIGQVGCTGYCTRPHLHFAVKKKGRMVNPISYIKSYPVQFERLLESRVATN